MIKNNLIEKHMRNRILLILLSVILLTPGLMAQNGENEDKKKNLDWYLNLGINIGGSMPVPLPAEVRKIKSYNPKINPHIGLSTVYHLNHKWGIASELSIGNKGMRVTDEVKYMHTKVIVSDKNSQDKREVDGYFVGKNMTNVGLTYLSLSVSAVYSFNERWEVKLGVYAASLGKTKFTGDVSDGYLRDGDPNGPIVVIEEDNPATFDFSDNMRDFDAGIIVGGKYNINDRIGIIAKLDMGLTDIFYRDQNPIEFKMQNIYGTIGVSYRLK